MEGLYSPFEFPFPKSIDRNKVLKAVVKVRPLRTIEYREFSTDEDADNFSQPILDENGFETVQYGFTKEDKEKCSDPEFSQGIFTHEFCELVKANAEFPQKAKIKGHGNGILISKDGYIATNFHLVSGAVEHLKKLDGYFEGENLPIKNIEIEYAYKITDAGIQYKKASEVFLAATYSMKDAYGVRLDLAVLKINVETPHFLPLAKVPSSLQEKIYSVGFSMRTARKEESKKLLGYADANYDLRVSTGQIIKIESENSFLADTDGAPGNSGSAAINEHGELVGIYCGSTGNGIVDPGKSHRRYVVSQKLEKLMK